ncbi:hypothetical protein ACFV14_36415 [Streptomyces zaomyceticus]|uniref:hypothetical protein n=1 Tax=Streptomyces zaomyceticus TaxID=68286 RepID=UPI003698C560
MTSRRKHWRDGLGTPATMVLFRTPDHWRYALYFSEPRGVADGYLARPGSDGEPDDAQAAAHAKAEELAGRPLTISWRTGEKPGWWTGAVTTDSP